jgi:hypothetical protein
MDPKKILKKLVAVRSAIAAKDQDLAEIQAELEKDLVPDPPRKRQDLKTARVEHYDRVYATGKWSKPAHLKKAK